MLQGSPQENISKWHQTEDPSKEVGSVSAKTVVCNRRRLTNGKRSKVAST